MVILPITTIKDVAYPTKRLLTIFIIRYEATLMISCHPFSSKFTLHKSVTCSF